MKPSSIASVTAAAVIAAFIAGCATSGPEPQARRSSANAPVMQVIEPNANLVVQGIPPVPASIAQQVEKYTDFRGHNFVDWHPTQREMLVSYRKQGASTSQLYRLTAPMAQPDQLTDFPDPVTRASYEPREGKYLVFQRGNGGDEADQVYRLDLADRQVTPLTGLNERSDIQGWLNRSSKLLVSSVPLDKTAQGGSRNTISQTLSLIDPAKPGEFHKVAELPGTGWEVGGISWDDKLVALTHFVSANESQVWLMTLANGRMTQVMPVPKSRDKPSVYAAGEFTRDNASFYVTSDQAGEFNELWRYTIANKRRTPVTRHIPWDIDAATQSSDGRLVALMANVDGREELRLVDGRTLKELPAQTLPDGNVSKAAFHRTLPELAMAVSSAHGPNQIFSFNPVSRELEQWTSAYAPPGIDTAAFGEQQTVRWKSFDGRMISGFINTPPARFTGPRPVIISIHGGPEAQARAGFINRSNYFVNELGIALIQPNVRGSSGYGKSFLALDNGMKREDSVKDIGALLDWIATQPQLDASRVLIMGGSYGGYMSLAASTMYADRIAGSIDIVGISNFVSFLEKTESYRRDLRRVEYGDERDPAMRSFLESISPITNAGRITKPLFVVSGRNDPRVPYTEGEQIVAKLRENKTPVWYLRAENEGHGFARKENADYQFYATVLFLQQTLLK